MIVVAAVPAKLEPRAVARALFDLLLAAAGAAPSRSLVEIQLAQIWFEGDGRSVSNSVGNLMAAGFVHGAEVATWAGGAWRPPWFEPGGAGILAERRAQMLAGKVPSAFRAYGSLAESLRDYMALFVHRYPALLNAAAADDVPLYASLYHSSGYCPDCSAAAVEAAIRARRAELARAGAFDGLDFGPAPPPVAPASPLALVARVTGSVVRCLPSEKGKPGPA